MEDTQMPTANEDKAPDPVLLACNEYYVSYKKAAEGSETQHKLIMALNNHILDQKSKIKELEWLMTKTAQDAKEQHDYHVQHHKQMLELSERHCDNQIKSRDMTIKLLEHNLKVVRSKLKTYEEQTGPLRLSAMRIVDSLPVIYQHPDS